jgi:hypothetical protein
MSALSPEDLDSYFAPIAGTLAAFASTRGLLLHKYYHDAPAWSLCFGHPAGGQAKVEVSAKSEDDVQVSAVWWLDDYNTFTRSLHWGTKVVTEKDPQSVALAVERAFGESLGWSLWSWNQVVGGYEPSWSTIGAERFHQFANSWPVPKPHSAA